jgi:murein DD-endopeptidase MepM/ murein hydrolase activator NlpD
MAAAAMLFAVQTGRDVSGAQMRSWARTSRLGTNNADVQRAFRRLGQRVEADYGMPFYRFLAQTRAGRSAIVGGWYGRLPQGYSLDTDFAGPHAIFVLGYSREAINGRGGFYVMDPLGTGSYEGRWWTVEAMRNFAWNPRSVYYRGRALRLVGAVVLQGSTSTDAMRRAGGLPSVHSLWSSAKTLLSSARKVTVSKRTVRRVRGDLAGSTLYVRDPALRLTPAVARQWRMIDWPVRIGTRASKWRPGARDVRIGARTGAPVRAAAPGRVVFRGTYLNDAQSIWIEHGPKLFTRYDGVKGIRVQPGQWVDRGARIADVDGRKGRRGTMLFSVISAGQPWSKVGRADPARYFDQSSLPSR